MPAASKLGVDDDDDDNLLEKANKLRCGPGKVLVLVAAIVVITRQNGS